MKNMNIFIYVLLINILGQRRGMISNEKSFLTKKKYDFSTVKNLFL